jgi:CheY-like chemotaxis protein
MAHDLNNVLAPIMMSIELLRNYVKHPAALEILDIVENAARRGSETVGQVLAFARGSEGDSGAVDISAVLRDVAKMADDTFPKNVRVAAEIDDGLWPFEGDSTQIHQIILNFCVNSRDAMPDGGEISIKGYAGFLEVRSHPGQGTLFQVYLPSAAARPDTLASPPRKMLRGSGQTVLVVDDETAIREVTRHTLEAFGYKVLLAANGSKALATYMAHQSEIAVLITDKMMPVMDGIATAKALRLINPTLPIITTGLGAQPGRNGCNGSNSRLDHFLSKPYTAETLLNSIHEILAKNPAD